MNKDSGQPDAPPDIEALLAAKLGAATLAGVSLSLVGRCLAVDFSHPYLAAYWLDRHREALEAAARLCLGQDLTFAYQNSEAGQPAARAAAPPDKATDFFGDFIASGANSIALRAARELCDPATPLAALLLTGESGVGKSLLLTAIANTLAQCLGKGAVLLASARALPPPDFWQRSRALLVDDIQLLAHDSAGQNLLAAHLDAAASPGRVIALACLADSATVMRQFESRLRKRLGVLLQLELEPPDLAERTIWLERQNSRRKLGLANAQILALARQGRHISELRGLLQKFEFYGRLGGGAWAWEELKKLAPPEQAQPWLEVFALVASRLAVAEADLVGASRRREIVFARQVAMYLARQKLGLSYPELGRIFGGRDHATVIHSVRKIEQLQQIDEHLHNLLTELAKSLF